VQALTRRRQKVSIPKTVDVVEVNYNDDNALRNSLRNQDAVVSCLGDVPAAVQAQESLLNASLAAGVKRFVPSEFGSNTTNIHVMSYPFFKAKVEHQRRLRQAARTYRDFSYSLLITGPFLDWGLSKVPFIINVGTRTAEGIVWRFFASCEKPMFNVSLTRLRN
jgi:putative NADH-flavin reductase